MDRNLLLYCHRPFCTVATREGGVDRNSTPCMLPEQRPASPPARVAWIETSIRRWRWRLRDVATREGGVDRNNLLMAMEDEDEQSPPARVAWIETIDREHIQQIVACRHPRGWRG